MKTEDLTKLENLSKARRIFYNLVLLIDTAKSLNKEVPETEINSILIPLLAAKMASANLMSRYGDAKGYVDD